MRAKQDNQNQAVQEKEKQTVQQTYNEETPKQVEAKNVITATEQTYIEIDGKRYDYEKIRMVFLGKPDIKPGQTAHVFDINGQTYIAVYTGVLKEKVKAGNDEMIRLSAKVVDVGKGAITFDSKDIIPYDGKTIINTFKGTLTKQNYQSFTGSELKPGDIVQVYIKDGKAVTIIKY